MIDLSSARDPKLYVVENELASHDPLRHIAVQILQFSLSFETSPHQVKSVLKDAMNVDPSAAELCESYTERSGIENIDVLLERMVYGDERFNALVVIDELSEKLEKALVSRFQFPVEILTLERYATDGEDVLYRFDPFLQDLTGLDDEPRGPLPPLDPAEIDTIVVPARDDGFQEVFLRENRWYAIRMHSSMRSKTRHIAVYRVAPVSAVTHIAPVSSVERWKETSKYVVNFAEPAKEIGPIALVPKGVVKAPQAPRYTSIDRLKSARDLDGVF